MFFNNFWIPALVFCCAVLFGGCRSVEPPRIIAAAPQVDEATLAKRIDQFSQAVAGCEIRGLAFHPENLRTAYFGTPEEFVGKVKEFGINRLYMYVNTPQILKLPRMKEFLEAAAAAGIPVEAVLPQANYVIGPRGNFILQIFLSGGTTLEQMFDRIREFHTPGFSGITVQVEPHVFTRANTDRPKRLVYAWDDATFGAGLDNDMIMKATLEQMKELTRHLGTLGYTLSIPDFYRPLVEEKKLTVGSCRDFQEITPRLIVRNSGNKPTEMIASISADLAKAQQNQKTVLAGITLAEHTSVTEGALRRRNWDDFVNIVKHAVDTWKTHPAFNGVVLGPFAEIESLHEEK